MFALMDFGSNKKWKENSIDCKVDRDRYVVNYAKCCKFIGTIACDEIHDTLWCNKMYSYDNCCTSQSTPSLLI